MSSISVCGHILSSHLILTVKYNKSIFPIWERQKMGFTGKTLECRPRPDLHLSPNHRPWWSRSRTIIPSAWAQTPKTLSQNESLGSQGCTFFFVKSLDPFGSSPEHLRNICLSLHPLFHTWLSSLTNLMDDHFVFAWTFPMTWTFPVIESSIPGGALHGWELFLLDWASILPNNAIPWTSALVPGRIISMKCLGSGDLLWVMPFPLCDTGKVI